MLAMQQLLLHPERQQVLLLFLYCCITAVPLQLERVLGNEQRRSDFMPRDDALSFDRPTSACLLGTALLSALGAATKDTLEGNNLHALLAEVRTAQTPGTSARCCG